jgi:hypothetical protein
MSLRVKYLLRGKLFRAQPLVLKFFDTQSAVEAAVAGVSEVYVYDVREEGGFIQDI